MVQSSQVHSLPALANFSAIVVLAKVDARNVAYLGAFLSVAEVERSQSFKCKEDRLCYILAHGLKRCIISQYLCVEPSALSFTKGPHGKPYCLNGEAPHFNLSHSGDWVALVFSEQRHVGIDIDFLRSKYREGLARKICNDRQFEWYRQQGDKRQAFLFLWSQKEALSKACGRGIAVGMSTIECSGVIGEEEVLFGQRSYRLHSRHIGPNGVLSCAIDGGGSSPEVFLWEADSTLSNMS